MEQNYNKIFTKEISNLFIETFEKVEGFYLDKNTSLFETLNNLSFQDASKQRGPIQETIAAHVYHIIFYIKVLHEYITDVRTGKTDWKESWKKNIVNQNDWDKLKESLRIEYNNLIKFIQSIKKWDNGDYVSGVVSILVHCAYHLGAIRQLIEL